ncbi:FAD-dependent oxidoreductase [Nocardioides sp. cx-173]|uniref:FAD-dependent oxidoreductase n=1 Tax=Nocardioides sp. cx-173 TaxID=2898796 RepID=UPI001E58E132|nr:FAD-dependent oxidoreductase [Nocardioides sp. cx-173]MCD4524356.1 FAD-dependent oxidoreductase [Nocardioides sp. cx-173]UGB43156.1 FAD-dependent oxidoreductase [Nocardioides sp. cx-173]
MADEGFDLVVVGTGPAGLTCAIRAARGGARVLLVEKDRRIGGTLHLSGGHLSAGGTSLQRERGIDDDPERHLADIQRISHGTGRRDLMSLVTTHAPEVVEWLVERGMPFDPETPRLVYGHEPYEVPRTVYGVEGGLSILQVLAAELDEVRAAHDLLLWTDAPVTGLTTDADGRVTGVEVYRGGAELEVEAQAVVLATGGYGADAELFAERHGIALVTVASRTSTGDGIHLGRSVGAGLQGEGTYLPTFGGMPDPQAPHRANWAERVLLTTERAPREIYVDRAGRRWIAEDEPSIDLKERALTGLPDQVFWTVFDDDAVARAGGDQPPIVLGWAPDDLRRHANVRPGVYAADTLEELAGLAGIDPTGLVASVAAYNRAVAEGHDPEFGRTHLPAPIAAPPFYALLNQGIAVVTFDGLDIDDSFAVRDEAGAPIPGLFAIGEVIGAGATCGNSFCSGMLLTPALVFGRLLGERCGSLRRPTTPA